METLCKKVFVIEDDTVIRESLTELLKLEGYGVESFATGHEAIVRLKQHTEPCLVLLDMMMPVMSGVQFMLEFHKLPHAIVPIPVYLFAANATKELADNLGCLGFMRKPADLEVILNLVNRYCHKRSDL